MLDTRWCVLYLFWITSQLITPSVCYWRSRGGRDTESPAQCVCVCGACNGRWGCAAAHWTERCRKWGARFHIWRGGPPMRTGTGVCVNHRLPTTAGDSWKKPMRHKQICLHTSGVCQGTKEMFWSRADTTGGNTRFRDLGTFYFFHTSGEINIILAQISVLVIMQISVLILIFKHKIYI